MPDDTLYETDILAWSRAQAARLRRVAAGERVNDVDWEHVIEEVEDVGRSELKSTLSLFRNAIEHALKVVAWPGHEAAEHWVQEIGTFLGDARDRFEPGMAQHVDVAAIYARALRGVRGLAMRSPPDPLPETIALTLAELTSDAFGARALIACIQAGLPREGG